MHNQRIRIRVLIGISALSITDEGLIVLGELIGKKISKKTAGCTLNYNTGIWTEKGNQFLDEYTSCELQKNIDIDVSVLPDRQIEILDFIKKTLSSIPELKSYGVNDIHIEEQVITIGHFSL